MPITEVNGELVRAFEFYLKTEKNCQQNTVIRYMKCLKKIINLALANEWIEKNPFAGIKFHEKEVVREFLTMDELMTIYQKEFFATPPCIGARCVYLRSLYGIGIYRCSVTRRRAYRAGQQRTLLDSQDTPKDK